MEARLSSGHPSALEERLAIADLFARYAEALDGGDVEGVVSCFTEDAEMVSPSVGTLKGRRDGILQFARRFAALQAGGTQTRHFISNVIAKVDGDRAEASAYLMCGVTRDGVSRMLPPGRYSCKLAKVDGTWLFERRVIEHDAAFKIEGV
jgi:uncharacterized protein (TIGR02246 family)